ncbi:MAG TPA: DEAD/DEAH box helicase, partial [Solirubrobacteraceae bacterium]
MIARVEPLTTTRRLSGPFDYLPPEDPVGVGSVVRIPFGRQRLDGVVVDVADSSEVPAEKLVRATGVRAERVPEDLVELALWMAAEYCSTPARALSLVLPPPGRERTLLWAERTAAALEGQRLTANQRALLERLPGPAGGDLGALRRLEARGLVAIAPRARRRAPRTDAAADRAVTLTPEQEAALAAVRRGGSHLLHGVTGSGKTEVYLRACAETLAAGRGVIVLVPEIALTPQTVARFQARFGDTVALLHSALGEGERYDEWRRLRAGEARIAVGPRSAVFAPVADLGLVVIDEEHDGSYKHEGDPRYDARLVAAERARRSGAALLAGSATPRPETWRAMEHLTLPSRVDSRSLPPVKV